MNVSLVLLTLSGVFYFLAFVFHLSTFMGITPQGHRPAFFLMRLGFFLGTFYFAAEAVEQGFFLPVENLSQAMSFFSWSIAFVYLVLLIRAQSESFGLILTPILSLFVAVGCLTFHLGSQPLPRLLNPYFTIHIVSAFFAYASFALSFAASILYLIQHYELKGKRTGNFYHKLPSLEELDKLIYQPILWGVPLLTIAVVIGFVWSKSAFGEYWIFEPKTMATLLTGLVYFVILYLHYISSVRGKRVVVLSLLAFIFVLCSFVGTRFIEGSHNFLR